MSITGSALRTAARAMAQDSPATGGTGVQLLLNDPGDYNAAIANALVIFRSDRPNLRVVDVTLGVGGFRYALSGTGTILPTTGLDAWIDGGSGLIDIFHPWDPTAQGIDPNDRNDWRVVRTPTGEALELIATTGTVGQLLRVTYVAPHQVNESDASLTSIRVADQQAIITLAASLILQEAAVKSVQNTGNTGLPNDVVDRRTQSDVFRSRAKELREYYLNLIGQATGDDLTGASGSIELDAYTSYRGGFLWHPNSTH